MADVPAIRITAIDEASRVIDKIAGSLSSLAVSIGSVATVAATLKAALDFGDVLQTMSDRTGVSVERLQTLSAVAAQSGTNLEAFAKSFKNLANSMLAAQNQASEQAKLFRALGISITDASGHMRSVDAVAGDLSSALNRIDNSTVKLAAGTKLLGRNYIEVAAAFTTYNDAQAKALEIQEQFGTVTGEAARAADAFGDRLKLIEEGVKGSTLNALTKGFIALESAIRSTQPTIAKLSNLFGEFFGWLGEKGARLLINTEAEFKVIGAVIAAITNAIKTRSAADIVGLRAELTKIEQERAAGIALITTQIASGGREVASQGLKDTAINSKDVADAMNTATKATHDWLEELLRLTDALGKENAGLQAQLDNLAKFGVAQHATSEATTEFALSHGKLGTTLAAMELIYPQLAEMLRAYALGIAAANDKLKTQIQLTEEGLKFDEGTVKAFRESGEAYKKFTDDLAENIKQLNFEADAVLMSTKQREIAIKMLEAEHKGLQENSKDWVEYREKVIAAVERKESLQAIADLWKGIENAAHDAFMNIYEGGKLTFERLRDSLKNTLLELLYQMTVKKWIINIGTNLTSEGGGGGIGSSLMSGFGGNIGSIVSGAGSLFGASGFAAGAAGDAFLPAALAGTEGLAGTAGALAGAGFGATAAMAIPYVGIAIAVGMLVKSYLDSKRGGPKVGGFAGVGEAFFTGETTAAGSAAAKKIVDQIGVSFNETIKRLGGKPGGIGFSLGYDTDPQGSAMSRVIAAVYAGNANIYKSINASVGRSPEELQAELTAQTKKMLIVALQSADLPGALGKLFARINVEAISGDAVDNLVQFAEAYGELADLFNASPLDDALKAIKEQAGGAQKALENQADALSKMIDVYDGSAQATTDLSAATSAYYKNVVAVIAQVEQLKTQIADLFASSIKDYTFAKLDTSGKYKYLKDDAEKLYQELQGATDANRIDALAKLIDSDMREAFGLLTPEQQAQLADEFIKGANETSKIAAEQLQKVQQAAEERSQSVLTTIQTALEAAAEKIAAGGDAVIVGGNAITNAAQYIVDATARTSLVTG